MYAYLQNYFSVAVFAGKPISWQLRRALKNCLEVMPAELCQVMKLPARSTYAEGALKYNIPGLTVSQDEPSRRSGRRSTRGGVWLANKGPAHPTDAVK